MSMLRIVGRPEVRSAGVFGSRKVGVGSDLDDLPCFTQAPTLRSRVLGSRRDPPDSAGTRKLGSPAKVGAGKERNIAQIRSLSALFRSEVRLIELPAGLARPHVVDIL